MRFVGETDIHCDLHLWKHDNLTESLKMSCYRLCHNLYVQHNFLLCLQGARTNKMEKADILEMTVKHLRNVQRHQFEGRHIVPAIPIITHETYLQPSKYLKLYFQQILDTVAQRDRLVFWLFCSSSSDRSNSIQQISIWIQRVCHRSESLSRHGRRHRCGTTWPFTEPLGKLCYEYR